MKRYETLLEFDSPAISDALDACKVEGALLGIKPNLYGKKIVGPAYTVEYAAYDSMPQTFQGAGEYIDDVPQGSIIVIDNQGREDCTTWGGILTQVAMLKKISGTVVNGAIRDLSFIRKVGYPVFSRSVYMRSGKNRVYKSHQQVAVTISNVRINPGDIIFGDDNGVIVIPKDLLDEVIQKIQNIDRTETNILKAVNEGVGLKEARAIYRYDRPWGDSN